MGMQDNPLVGDYTKGISKDTVGYFKALDMRISREKADPRKVALDFTNPLFAMLEGPVDPMGLDRHGKIVAPRQAHIQAPVKRGSDAGNSVKVTASHKKPAWRTVSLSNLSLEMAQKVNELPRGKSKTGRR